MSFSEIRARGIAWAALALILGGLVGCNSDSGGTAALPPSNGAPPPPPPKENLGPDGKPRTSSSRYDSAFPGGKAP